MLERLTEKQCRQAILDGEFGQDVLGAAATAVVLTQHWCPQWQWMRSYLESLPESRTERILYVEYDREPFYEEFMAFKEDRFENREIPYVRYYKDGVFASASNYVSKDGFLRRLRAAAADRD